MLQVVQICLRDCQYAEQLCQYLRDDPTFENCQIVCGSSRELCCEKEDGVRVIDAACLLELPKPLDNPAKTVLITSGMIDLEQVWESGILSILQKNESLEYVKLAILAALLRPVKSVWPQRKLKAP